MYNREATEIIKKLIPHLEFCLYDNLMKLDDKNYIIPISSVINVSE